MTIECKINGHTYTTSPLYFEEFTTLGFIIEEKLFPFFACLTTCISNNLSDAQLLTALYKACKDIFNREDLKYISNLVLNKEHMTIDGKKLDQAEWEKHWQAVGFIEYRVVVMNFIKENIGNFTSLSALIPAEWTDKLANKLKERLSNLLTQLSEQSQK